MDAFGPPRRNLGEGGAEAPRPMTASGLIAVGVFGAVHGVRGEIRIKSYTSEPSAIAAYGPLSDAAGTNVIKIIAVRPLKGEMVLAKIEGVFDRKTAERLEGVEIFALRENLPATGEDEFYHADLVGMRAVSPAGAEIGRVIALRNFGAGDILEIAPCGGGETLLLPFTKAVAPEIDIAGGRIVIAPPREIDGGAGRDEG
jgi:16S rRNA processing protein RimM